MTCFYPIDAWQPTERAKLVFRAPPGRVRPDLRIPCGQCIGCRLDKSREWAIRIMCEAHTSGASCFLTLTYDEAHYRQYLEYSDIQLFLKRERKRIGKRLRFFVAGEYGDVTGRAHWHMCLFGEDYASTRKPYDSKLFEDDGLTRSWGKGAVLIGKLEYDSARYVASYVTKKLSTDKHNEKYVDPETGEILRSREMARMSLKPGIGYDFFRKYYDEILRTGYVFVGGRRVPAPRYFLDSAPFLHAVEVKAQRMISATERWATETDEQSRERLAALEAVAKAALALKRRQL